MKKIEIQIPELDYAGEEAYKTLRTNLQFCGDNIKVVDVTSCMPNEGKSLSCIQLSNALAASGKNVLLIDADMRKSVLLGTLKASSDGTKVQGLSHFLSGQAKLEDVLYQTNVDGMYIIFSGSFPPNPAELLGNRRFEVLISTVRKSFDYVIIDTPPLGTVIDSAVAAHVCDGAILVISANAIEPEFAKDVISQLKKTDCPILGSVLTKVDLRHSSRYGGKYFGKYYGKYYGEYGHEQEAKHK